MGKSFVFLNFPGGNFGKIIWKGATPYFSTPLQKHCLASPYAVVYIVLIFHAILRYMFGMFIVVFIRCCSTLLITALIRDYTEQSFLFVMPFKLCPAFYCCCEEGFAELLLKASFISIFSFFPMTIVTKSGYKFPSDL